VGPQGISFVGLEGPSKRLRIDTEEALPEELGWLQVGSLVSGQKLEQRYPVQVRFVDKSAKLFKKWLPAMIAAFLLLLLILWFAMLHRFSEQEVRPLMAGALDRAYKLRDWKAGLTGRKAPGTPEVKEGIRFLMSGMKGFGKPACAAEPVRPPVKMEHNGAAAADRKPLKHGDEIKLTSEAGEEWVYYYFERTPTKEELDAILKALEEKDNLYLED
jgi:hypothetical protein